jgi:8-oxo-dGTP pyrophosphatase MutT (NUDIX family)
MKLHKQAVCALILADQGKALSVSRRHAPHLWGLIGGKVDPGETPLVAVAREVYEEAGFRLNPDLLVPLYVQACDGETVYWTTTYLYTGVPPRLDALRPEAGLEVAYRTLESLADEAVSPFAAYNRGVLHAVQAVDTEARRTGATPADLAQASLVLQETCTGLREELAMAHRNYAALLRMSQARERARPAPGEDLAIHEGIAVDYFDAAPERS